MRYDFSSSFLVIRPPATNFGEAWELLCSDLLVAENGAEYVRRMSAPDGGIDIYNDGTQHAYQCKASEQGAGGTIPPNASIESLKSAVSNQARLPWVEYSFCTNAPYSTSGTARINQTAREMGVELERVKFLGPEYWDRMCTSHDELVRDRFYYRVTAGEKDVIDAFKKAGYFKKYVDQYTESIREHDFVVVVTNNRTPVEIEIPFSPELTVENYLDVAKQLLGITLEWTNYPDFGTSAGTNLSITVDQYAQTFSKKLSDLPIKSGDPLQLWIKIVWREKPQASAPSDSEILKKSLHSFMAYRSVELPKYTSFIQSKDRGRATVERHEAFVQGLIWDSFHGLKTRCCTDSSLSNDDRFKSIGIFQRDLVGLSPEQLSHAARLLGMELHAGDQLKIEVLRKHLSHK